MDKGFIKKLVACYMILLAILWGVLIYLYHHGLGPFDSPSDRNIITLAMTMFVTTFVSSMFMVPIAVGRFVYVDAHWRGMNRLLWTLVAIFVPYFVGLVVYLVVRSPMIVRCHSCNAVVNQSMLYCPQCGDAFKRQCASCRAALENTDRFCHHCGAAIAA